MTMQLATYTPDVLTAIDGCTRLAASTRQQYRKALSRYLATGNLLTDMQALQAYAQNLPVSSRAFLKSAIRLVTQDYVTAIQGQATGDNILSVLAVKERIDALGKAIEVRTAKGQKAHTWLSQTQVKALLDTCGPDRRGQRDRLALGLLVAAGLRRAEAVNLTFTDIVLQPIGKRLRTVLQVTGKGNKARVVPISDNLANALDRWSAIVGGEGAILRSINQTGEVGGMLSASAVFEITRAHGALMGKPDLAPHDLRRTFAQLGFEAGIPITQISVLLGHSSTTTTQRYLNLDLDLTTTASDFVPF